MKLTCSKRTRAFTLIELLVVVAIIALLMAILLPSLGRARAITKRTACAANMKAIGTSLAIYDQENGRYPIGQRESQANGNSMDTGSALPAGSGPPWPGSGNGFWSRSWSSSAPTFYSRNDGKYDMRRNFDPIRNNTVSGKDFTVMGSPKIWTCPGPSPARAIYAAADGGLGLMTGKNYFMNYMNLWTEMGNPTPGMGGNYSPGNTQWTRVLSGTGLFNPKGPFSSKAAPNYALAMDILGYEISASGQAFSNHSANGASRGEIINASSVNTDTMTARSADYASFLTGGNIVYNDGHAEFKKYSELIPAQMASAPYYTASGSPTIYFLDLTIDQQ